MAALAALPFGVIPRESPGFPPGLDALQRALADFSAPAPTVFAPFAAEMPAEPPADFPAEAMLSPMPALFALPEPEPEPSPDVERLVAEAVEAAEARLRAELEAEHAAALEAALATERQRHAFLMEMEVHSACGASADTLASGLAALRGEVAGEIAAACARLLAPVVEAGLARRAVAALDAALREALEGEARPRVIVSGPALLMEGLRARLGSRAPEVQWREAEGVELAAGFDGQVVETRLGEWAAALQAELEGTSP